MTRASIPRLRSVRFKDGRAPVRVFHSQNTGLTERFKHAADEVVMFRPNMGGYAIVAWSIDGATSVAVRTFGTPIPMLLIPEFVKTCVADFVHSKESE